MNFIYLLLPIPFILWKTIAQPLLVFPNTKNVVRQSIFFHHSYCSKITTTFCFSISWWSMFQSKVKSESMI